MHSRSVLGLAARPDVRVGHDRDEGEAPGADDDGPDLPGLDAPGVDEQELEVGALAQHPGVRGQHEVVLHHVKDAAPQLKGKKNSCGI